MSYSEERMKTTNSFRETEAKDDKTASSIVHMNVNFFSLTTQNYFLVRDESFTLHCRCINEVSALVI